MNLNPMTEEQIQLLNLIPAGNYSFLVIDAQDTTSKKTKKEMIKLKLKIWDLAGKERILYDNFVDHEAFQYKIRHFAELAGILDQYDSGNIMANSCIGKQGIAKVIIQKSTDSNYPDKNAVADYVVKKNAVQEPQIAENTPEFDDEIPF